ncbi:MAG: YeeE/YedE family protein [Syntrophobacteraceae bacterium]|nr:YeeE/YedE family protein [Syntrophobacteraceae bacterium]
MIETFFGLGALGSPYAFLASLLIGLAFGVALEKAGFGSSRRLAGIFYFRDMAVLKVMFSAMITAMLGLSYLLAFGWIESGSLYFMPTVFGAQIVGGLIFGIGFAMSGWCPGTGAVGLASGKIDALVFLVGAVAGSILFNELFSLVKPLYSWGLSGVRFVHDSLGMSKAAFSVLLTLAAVASFWGAEFIERIRVGGGSYLNSPFLKTFSLSMIILAGGLFVLPGSPQTLAGGEGTERASSLGGGPLVLTESDLLRQVEEGEDHMDPSDLADRLMAGDGSTVLIDLRTPGEYETFHIRGAVNVPLSELPSYLEPAKKKGIVVLYSNGMTHPAQAGDALRRLGHQNVAILTDGLKGFVETCLKPVSLRSEPVPADLADRINRWRSFFAVSAGIREAAADEVHDEPVLKLPGLVPTDWLAANLGKAGVRVVDVRTQPEYNTGHIPGAVFISTESVRGVVGGIPSMLLPASMLAMHFSQMGIRPSDTVILVPGEKVHDATLLAMAFERLGHRRYGILDGGFEKWKVEQRPSDTELPQITPSRYPVLENADTFTVDSGLVLDVVKGGGGIILDVRAADYYAGKKSDEARAGHIPGAINRAFSEDVTKQDGVTRFKPSSELVAAYAGLIPSRETKVLVHCRTGHQASQTFFVLKNLLGYKNVLYYDAGWTEWAARSHLPVETSP